MKTFYRFLALVLTLITVAAALPLGVIAAPWLELKSETVENSATESTTNVTLTVDAGALADLLRENGVSPDVLQKMLDEADISGVSDLFDWLLEIVPLESLMTVISPEEILEKMSYEELMTYIPDSERDNLYKQIGEIAKNANLDLDAIITELKASGAIVNGIGDLFEDRGEGTTPYLNFNQLLKDAGVKLSSLVSVLDIDKLLEDLEASGKGVSYLLADKDANGAPKTPLLDFDGLMANFAEGYRDLDALIALIGGVDAILGDEVKAEDLFDIFEDKKDILGLLDIPNLLKYYSNSSLLQYIKQAELLPALRANGVNDTILAGALKMEDLEKDLKTDNTMIARLKDELLDMGTGIYSVIDVKKMAENAEMLAIFKKAVKSDVVFDLLTQANSPISGAIDTDVIKTKVEALFTPEEIHDAEIVNNDETVNLTKLDAAVQTKGYAGLVAFLDSFNGINYQTVINNVSDVSTLLDYPQLQLLIQNELGVEQLKGQIANIKVDEISFESKLNIVGGWNGAIGYTNVPALLQNETVLLAAQSLEDPQQYVDIDGLLNDPAFSVQDLVDNNLVTMSALQDKINVSDIFNLPGVTTQKLVDLLKPKFETIGFNEAVAKQVEAWGETVYTELNLYEIALKQWDAIAKSEQGAALMSAAINQLLNHPTAVTDLGLIPIVMGMMQDKMSEIVNLVMGVLETNDLISIAKKVVSREHIEKIMLLVWGKVNNNIEGIVIDGTTVATTDVTGLQIDANALINSIYSIIPTLEMIGKLDNNAEPVVSTVIGVLYKEDGTDNHKVKNIKLDFVIKGDLETLQKVVLKLDELIKEFIVINYNNGTFDIDATLPEKLTSSMVSVYAKAIASERLDEDLRVKLMQLVNINANGEADDAMKFTDALTFNDLIRILDAVEPTALYNVMRNQAYVQIVLEKLSAKLGYDLTDVSLDVLVDKAAELPDMERIAEIIENKTGKNVMGYIETAANKADGVIDRLEKISQVQSILAAVEGRFGFDLSELSAAELVDKAADKPLAKTISDAIAARVGVHVRELLLAEDVDTLYQMAVDKLATKEGAYNKVINYIKTKAQILPDSLLNARIADFYAGNGTFTTGDKARTVNARELIEKAINRLVARAGLTGSAADTIIKNVMSKVNGGESITVDVNFTANFKNLYQIKYYTRESAGKPDAEKVLLFSAFLPAGANLEVFKSNMALTGYDFLAWAQIDAEGNETALYTMPAADTEVYANLTAAQVTLMVQNKGEGAWIEYDQFLMHKGGTLGSIEAFKNALTVIDVANGQYKPAATNLVADWKLVWKDATGETANIYDDNSKISGDITLYATWEISEYTLTFDGIDHGEYTVEMVGDQVVVTVNKGAIGETYMLKLNALFDIPGASVLVKELDDDNVTVLHSIEIPAATLAQIKAVTPAGKDAEFSYQSHGNKVPDSFKNSYYADNKDDHQAYCTDSDFYTFEILIDGTEAKIGADEGFAQPIVLQVPFADATDGSDTGIKTFVHTMEFGGVRELVQSTIDDNKLVTITATHFSDYVIANEALVTLNYVTERNVDVLIEDGFKLGTNNSIYLPNNAPFAWNASMFDLPAGYSVDAIKNSAGDKNYLADPFEMGKTPVELTVVLGERDYTVYYYINGALVATQAVEANDASFTLKTFEEITAGAVEPHYHLTNKWIVTGFGIYDPAKEGEKVVDLNDDMNAKTDIVVYAEIALNEYKVVFKEGETILSTSTVNKDNWSYKLSAPANNSKWVYNNTTYDTLDALFTAIFNGASLADGSEIVITPADTDYSDQYNYTITADGNISEIKIDGTVADPEALIAANEGKSITVALQQKAGYTAKLIVTKLTDVDNAVGITENEDGTYSFTMPSANIMLSVEYAPIGNVPYSIYKGQELIASGTGAYGETVTFSVTLNRNEKIGAVNATLQSVVVNDDGTRTLTYAFVIGASETKVTYTVAYVDGRESVVFEFFKILNGKLFKGEGDPTSDVENVKFVEWSNEVAGVIQFAVFQYVAQQVSFLWLWILIGVLVFFALIALIYLLHVNGKFGPNFLTRFACWIVNIFFAICRAFAWVGLKLFGGKDSKPADYGFDKDVVVDDGLAAAEARQKAAAELAAKEAEDEAKAQAEAIAAAAAAAEAEAAARLQAEQEAEAAEVEITVEVVDETEATEEAVAEAIEEVTEEATEEATEVEAEEAPEAAAEDAPAADTEEAIPLEVEEAEETAEETTEGITEEATEEATEEVTEEETEKKDNN